MDLTTSFHLLEWNEKNKNKKKNERKKRISYCDGDALVFPLIPKTMTNQERNERKMQKKPLKIL